MKVACNAIATDVWGIDTTVSLGLGMKLPLRMTVLGDAEGLVLVSPVEIDDGLHGILDGLGRVHTIIAPNRLHYRHVAQAKRRFPDAKLWGAPGLAQKRAELTFDETLATGELSPQLSCHLVEGAERLSEVVFFHRPTATLVVTDLVFSVMEANLPTRLLLRYGSGTLGRMEQSRLLRSMATDRKLAAQSIETLLSLPISRVVPAHGEVVDEQAAQRLRAGLWWMLGERSRPSLI